MKFCLSTSTIPIAWFRVNPELSSLVIARDREQQLALIQARSPIIPALSKISDNVRKILSNESMPGFRAWKLLCYNSGLRQVTFPNVWAQASVVMRARPGLSSWSFKILEGDFRNIFLIKLTSWSTSGNALRISSTARLRPCAAKHVTATSEGFKILSNQS